MRYKGAAQINSFRTNLTFSLFVYSGANLSIALNARICGWIGADLAVQQWRSHAQTKLRNYIPATCAC